MDGGPRSSNRAEATPPAPSNARPSPPETWIDDGAVRDEPGDEAGRVDNRRRAGSKLPPDVVEELRSTSGSVTADRDAKRLQDAVRAYERERYPEARRILERLARRASDVGAVRELHGLTLYRMGRWRPAIAELEAAEHLTGSVDQHPILADCHRALAHFDDVARLWDELRRAGAPAPVVVEGRIVAAGALADRGKVTDAIRLLEDGPVHVRTPREHHLRLWYALAALHERSGDLPRARELFRRVIDAAPDFGDAADRYRALS